jgi:hypothetical protein
MKKFLILLLGLLLTGCGVGFQYTTLNHAGHIDGIYSSRGYTLDTLNEFQVRHKLRTDFNFRYDFAQYALSQPASFDWNNRLLGNRYNWNRPYWGYSYYWDRTQMWNDWVWGYPYSNWSWNSWHRWNRPYWGWNNYGWNNYGWNNWGWRQQMNDYAWMYRNRSNTVRINGYRNSNRTSTRTVLNNRRVNINQDNVNKIASEIRRKVNKPRINNNKPRINNTKPRINTPRVRVNTPPRQSSTIRITPRTSTRSTNSTTVRSNSRRKN